MSSSKFIKIWFMVIMLAVLLVAFLNYIIDPFGVFHNSFLIKSKSLNERVVKIDYLNKNRDKYNSFLLGSSMIGTTDPKNLETYIKDSRFYNLTCSSSNMYDFKVLIKYLIKNNINVKNLYMQVDLTNMREYGKHQNHSQKHHYNVVDNMAWKFYLEYLTIFPFNAMKAKVLTYLKNADSTEFDIENTGMWFVKYKDIKREEDIKQYIANEPTFKRRPRRIIGEEKNINLIMKDYQEIVKLCDEHNINLVIFSSAHSHLRMDAFKIKDTISFINKLATYHDIWYFSGYNTITKDLKNYYEINHYISKVGALKAARIFDDRNLKIPKDFGVLITDDNKDEILKKELKSMLEYDKQKSSSIK